MHCDDPSLTARLCDWPGIIDDQPCMDLPTSLASTQRNCNISPNPLMHWNSLPVEQSLVGDDLLLPSLFRLQHPNRDRNRYRIIMTARNE
jgi:hypothetical protein